MVEWCNCCEISTTAAYHFNLIPVIWHFVCWRQFMYTLMQWNKWVNTFPTRFSEIKFPLFDILTPWSAKCKIIPTICRLIVVEETSKIKTIDYVNIFDLRGHSTTYTAQWKHESQYCDNESINNLLNAESPHFYGIFFFIR